MSEKFLMADRHREGEVEAEPVTIEQAGGAVVMHLDDGEDLLFDAKELQEALSE